MTVKNHYDHGVAHLLWHKSSDVWIDRELANIWLVTYVHYYNPRIMSGGQQTVCQSASWSVGEIMCLKRLAHFTSHLNETGYP